MANSIFKIFMFRATAYAASLPQEEVNRILAEAEVARKEFGARMVMIANCTWASEKWQYFGVEEFPDLDALQKHSMKLAGMNWFRYVDSRVSLGQSDQNANMLDVKTGIFKLYFSELTSEGHGVDQAGAAQAMEKLNTMQKENKVVTVITGRLFSSESYSSFGVEYYPNLTALNTYLKGLDEMQWPRYVRAKILLGSPL